MTLTLNIKKILPIVGIIIFLLLATLVVYSRGAKNPIDMLTIQQQNNIELITQKRILEGQLLTQIRQTQVELSKVQHEILQLQTDNVQLSSEIVSLTHPTNE